MYTSHVILMLGAIEYYILASKPEDLNNFGVHVCLVAGGPRQNAVDVQWILEGSTKHSCLLTTSDLSNSTVETERFAMSVNKNTLNNLTSGSHYQIEVDCCPDDEQCSGTLAKSMRSSNLDFQQGALSSNEVLCTGGFTQYFDPKTDYSSYSLILCAVHDLAHFTLIEWQTSLENPVSDCSLVYQYSDGENNQSVGLTSSFLMVPYTGVHLTVNIECFNKTNQAFTTSLQISPDERHKVCSNDVEEFPNLTTMNIKYQEPVNSAVKTGLNDLAAALFMATAFIILIAILLIIGYRHRAYIQARRNDRPLLAPVDEEEGTSGMAEIAL